MHSESEDLNSQRSFRSCERCGQPTPSHMPQCVNCGAISVQAAATDQQTRAERRFLRDLFSRATPVTYSILVFNSVVYLLMAFVVGGKFFDALVYMNDPGTLVAFGAKTNELLHNGEWFRLVTPIFIHGNLMHILLNSYAIWSIGPVVERLYGSARFLFIYLLAGVGGVIGSYIGGMARQAWIPGVGASGAIFGLFGLLVVFGYKYRDELPPNFRRAVTTGMVPVIAINLFIGFSIPAIDNSAHIGGLITGAALAFLISYIPPGRARFSTLGLAMLIVCVTVIAYSFVRAYRTSQPHLARRSGVVQHFLDSFAAGDDAMVGVYRSISDGGNAAPSRESIAQLEKAAAELASTTAPDERAEKLRQEMLSLMDRRSKGSNDSGEEFLRIRGEFKKWIAEEGPRYGYRLRNDPESDSDKQENKK